MLSLFNVFRSGNPTMHVQNLLLLLPSIRQADCLMKQFWNNARSDGFKLRKLLVEMLEETQSTSSRGSLETSSVKSTKIVCEM